MAEKHPPEDSNTSNKVMMDIKSDSRRIRKDPCGELTTVITTTPQSSASFQNNASREGYDATVAVVTRPMIRETP